MLSSPSRPVWPKVCLVYATLGRSQVLSMTFEAVARQTRRPSSIIVSGSSIADAGKLVDEPDLTVLTGPSGLARQRNRALRNMPPDTDIVVFFDDDFIPHPQWIEVVSDVFRRCPDIGAVTGNLIADGIKGPGIAVSDAFRMVERVSPDGVDWIQDNYSPYGCNMAFRVASVKDMSFDERLVLYGWLEDRDFGAGMARRGARMVKVGAALGVHMGVKGGRVPGVKLGYSQIVNPIYLYRKGTMRMHQVVDHIFRNVASNVVRSACPERYIDRRGRLYGNLRGIMDLLRGRLTPEKAGEL